MGLVLGDEAELCVSDYVWAWYLVMRLNILAAFYTTKLPFRISACT